MRSLAEMENVRTRSVREVDNAKKFGSQVGSQLDGRSYQNTMALYSTGLVSHQPQHPCLFLDPVCLLSCLP